MKTAIENIEKVDCGQTNLQYVCNHGLFKLNEETQEREYFCQKLNGWCQPFEKATTNKK